MVEEKKSRDLSDYKKKYHTVRHHAWAGSVLLGVLLAVRVFLEAINFDVDDIIFVTIGLILIIYTLAAVFLTYRYREGLSADSEKKIIHVDESDEVEKEKVKADLEKERLKAEKKKAKELAKLRKKQAKAEVKKAKKQAKEQEKKEKKKDG
ncbi:MAG: hypothetical protein V5A64_04730 [Candidatus Thermoplasmatota archaeon]